MSGRHRAQISDLYFRHLEHIPIQDIVDIQALMNLYRKMIFLKGSSSSHRPRYGSIPYHTLYLKYAPMWPEIA